MIIYKKEDGYWPRLQNGHKLNFVKVDFQRWRDEDEEDEEEPADPMGGLDFSSLMQQAGESQLPSMDHLVSSIRIREERGGQFSAM
jgi:prostaglandin-E synthase